MNRLKVATLREAPLSSRRTRRRYITFTKIMLNWPSNYVQSKWYFLSYGSEEVYLKQGWNIFGRRSSNHIQLMEPLLRKSCDLSVFVPDGDGLPVMYNVSGLCLYFEVLMPRMPYLMHNNCIITIPAEGRSILFKFYDKSLQGSTEPKSN